MDRPCSLCGEQAQASKMVACHEGVPGSVTPDFQPRCLSTGRRSWDQQQQKYRDNDVHQRRSQGQGQAGAALDL